MGNYRSKHKDCEKEKTILELQNDYLVENLEKFISKGEIDKVKIDLTLIKETSEYSNTANLNISDIKEENDVLFYQNKVLYDLIMDCNPDLEKHIEEEFRQINEHKHLSFFRRERGGKIHRKSKRSQSKSNKTKRQTKY